MRYILLTTFLIFLFLPCVGYGEETKNKVTFEELKQEYEQVKILVNNALITEIFNQLSALQKEVAELRKIMNTKKFWRCGCQE